MRGIALVSVCLMLVGCAANVSPDETVGETDSAIIGGTPTTGDPAIVALYGKKPGEDKGSLCTATLIAPKVLLTAAHCVSPAVVGEGLVFSALLGANLTDQANPSPRIAVTEVHWDTQFNAQNLTAGHDIGVAILATPMKATPLPYNAAVLPSSLSGTNIRLVGYGLNDGFQQTGAGIKRKAEIRLNSFDDKFVVTGGFGSTMCSGDSGGPVLAKINGVETVIGVNSYGFIYCLASGNSTRVDSYSDFVDSYVR